MNYQAIAQSILQTLPPSQLQPKRVSKESDDERIAQVVWMRMQLEMNFDRYLPGRSLLLM
ncbi:MAG: hypothetical protein HC769_36035 [Cyanobacteria bacterium CRU_2_1]|nr:hypothetical protein [Cyanobacteria bacterium CRU_2_1]